MTADENYIREVIDARMQAPEHQGLIRTIGYDDLRQELWLQVYERLGAYDPSRASWQRYVQILVDGALRRIARDESRRIITTDIPEDLVIPDKTPPIDIERALKKMPSKKRRLCYDVMRRGIRRAAKMRGVSKQQIRRNLKQLRKYFDDEDL